MSNVRTLRLVLCTALLAAAAVSSSLLVSSAAAANSTRCGEQVVNDWYGNLRIDKIYPLECYRAAIRTLPPDVRDYSKAEDDILRALAYARQGQPDPGPSGGPAPSAEDDPPTTTDTPPETRTDDEPVLPDTNPGNPSDPGEQQTNADDAFDTSGPSSIPIPLFILGGLALLLLAAGAAGYLSRRAQARRPGGPPTA